MIKFTSDNSPNIGRLVNSMRAVGYSKYSAILDILDNSIDAQSTMINIYVDHDKSSNYSIIVSDNGVGMPWFKLNEALKLGSETTHKPEDFGKFGMGLTTASFSFCLRTEIFTRYDGGPIMCAIQDIQEIERRNAWVKHITTDGTGDDPDAIDVYRKYLGGSKHGTVIQFLKGDRLTHMEQFVSTLLLKVGLTYYKKLNDTNLEIYIYDNGVKHKVESIDPLMIQDYRTRVDYDKSHILQYVNEVGEQSTACVAIKIAVIPDTLKSNCTNYLPINEDHSGIYFLRNGRLMASARKVSGIFEGHSEKNRIRIEVDVPPTVDNIMTVSFTKQSVEPIGEMRALLRKEIIPVVKRLVAQLKPKKASLQNDSQSECDAASELIKRYAHLLLKPIVTIEKRNPKTLKGARHTGDGKSSRAGFAKIQQKECNMVPSIRVESLGADEVLYKRYFVGCHLNLVLNSDHAFYQTVIASSVVETKIHFFVFLYALASAEKWYDVSDEANCAITDEQRTKIMDNVCTVISHNTRVIS